MRRCTVRAAFSSRRLGSLATPRINDTSSAMTTSRNGDPATMMIVCNDDRMSVPPDSSIATAMRVVIRPHTPVTHGVGLTRPR